MEFQFEIGEEVLSSAYCNGEHKFLIFNKNYLKLFSGEFTIIDCRFKILGFHHNYGFLVQVLDENIAHTTVIDFEFHTELKENCQINLDLTKYLNKHVAWVSQNIFRKIHIKEGYNCCVCKDYYEFAVANQLNGNFACYRCRMNPRNGLEK